MPAMPKSQQNFLIGPLCIKEAVARRFVGDSADHGAN